MTLLAAKQFNKIYYREGVKYRLTVRAVLEQLGNNPKPHFSITGDVEYQAKNNRWVLESCGAIHDIIAELMPELKPLILVHLADEDGVPMHAYTNAGYWAGQTKWQSLDLPVLANHLRVSEKMASEMLDYITNFWGELDKITTPEMAWEGTCADYKLPDQWKQEAADARAMLNELPQLQEAK